jgi:hypothetical protein
LICFLEKLINLSYEFLTVNDYPKLLAIDLFENNTYTNKRRSLNSQSSVKLRNSQRILPKIKTLNETNILGINDTIKIENKTDEQERYFLLYNWLMRLNIYYRIPHMITIYNIE